MKGGAVSSRTGPPPSGASSTRVWFCLLGCSKKAPTMPPVAAALRGSMNMGCAKTTAKSADRAQLCWISMLLPTGIRATSSLCSGAAGLRLKSTTSLESTPVSSRTFQASPLSGCTMGCAVDSTTGIQVLATLSFQRTVPAASSVRASARTTSGVSVMSSNRPAKCSWFTQALSRFAASSAAMGTRLHQAAPVAGEKPPALVRSHFRSTFRLPSLAMKRAEWQSAPRSAS
mmetsp:Transcript_30454/g.87340  ORF Transcript_30454/g.87340 Transcript_30454/m.87340 type:complete len:230 (+) Transcript_30454:762-1451(+)